MTTFNNPYAVPSDFIGTGGSGGRIDCRLAADLVTDDNMRLGSDTNVATIQSALATNQTILDVLADASGIINSACLAGERYTVSQLQSLTDVDQQYLVRLTCALAFGLLVMRRGSVKETDMPPDWKMAMDALERLRNGEIVFNLITAEEAGIPSAFFPSCQQYQSLGLYRDYCAPRGLPPRLPQQT